MDPLDLAAARAGLATQGTDGALVTFTGIVRSDPMPGTTERVARLVFECYPEMALEELERIRAEALQRPGVTGLSIHHRHGPVAIGEDIVLVLVTAGHRQEAFEAATWTMDEVKRRVPLWKQEVGTSGTTRWVDAAACGCHNRS